MAQPDYKPAGYCPKCGYRIDPGTCPECGRAVKRPWRLHPRVVRRYRRLTILIFLLGLGFAGWRYGPDLAARHAPSSALVWVYEFDFAGADWAATVLRSRYTAAFPTGGYAARDTINEFERRASEVADDDWGGHYAHGMFWLLGGRGLTLSDWECLWHFSGAMQPGPIAIGQIESFDGHTLRLHLPVDRAAARWARADRFRQWLDSEFTLIRWGDWRYLVASEELVDFCNDVNAGEPLDEFHLTRTPAEITNIGEFPGRPCAVDPPQMPPPFDRCILSTPVDFKVVAAHARAVPTRGNVARLAVEALGGSGLVTDIYDLTVETDPSARIFVGMRIYPSDRLGMAHVIRTSAGRCDARYVELSVPGSGSAPSSGTLFSTLAPSPIPIQAKWSNGQRLGRAMLGLPPLPSSAASRPSDPFEVAKRRRCVESQDWFLLELARELRK